MKSMRQATLETLGLGNALEIFRRGEPPVGRDELVDKVFGPRGERGCLVISGGNGIVGSGKAMQFCSRLLPYDVPIVTLDLPDAPDGIGRQYPGLKRSFGQKRAGEVMANIVRFNYDGSSLPAGMERYRPRFLLEAIPEILDLKRSHYDLVRAAYPGIEIRSVTSGFPSSELGVGILHPSYPHEINKVWESIEERPSEITHLLWALGLVPIPVGDYWSFILDVLFCGTTQAAVRYHRATNMPFWKVDKYVRRLLGPNPLRAHDAIGPGASFLTWSCLHHLAEKYGDVFRPSPELVRRKESGESWYPSVRPSVDWEMRDEEEFRSWILGPLFQMTSLLIHEKRAHLSHINTIGEICAQFTRGILAVIRDQGPDNTIRRVEAYHRLHPEAAGECWFPDSFSAIETPEWRQLYVNAEHDGNVGVITIGRESLNRDVVEELGRAVDWLKAEGIERVIVTGDFHLSTQLVGADTTEFFPALEKEEEGLGVSRTWSEAARRLNNEFRVSVGFINGKRCLGGMLELLMHCHYLVSIDSAQVGMPEVTLPVVPGMEGCHWPFRKASPTFHPNLLELLLTGRLIPAGETVGWLVDSVGPMEDALKTAWLVATGGDHGLKRRELREDPFSIEVEIPGMPPAHDILAEAARQAIVECALASCSSPLSDALEIQAKHSAGFMLTKECREGSIGSSARKILGK